MSEGPLFLSMAFEKFELLRRTECLDAKPHEGPRNEKDPRRLHVSPSQPSSILPGDEKSLSDPCEASEYLADESYHPESYKRRFCQDFSEEQGCQKKETCGFAHSELELRMTPLHLLKRDESFDLFWLKSEFCPFRTEHDQETCVYAHGWGDFKRPFFESQQPLICPLWNAASNQENQGDRNGVARKDKYASGCPRGFDCEKCHGPKELECHPLMRKGLGDAKICGGPPPSSGTSILSARPCVWGPGSSRTTLSSQEFNDRRAPGGSPPGPARSPGLKRGEFLRKVTFQARASSKTKTRTPSTPRRSQTTRAVT